MFFAIFPPARPHKRARTFAFFVALVAIVGATPVHAQWKPDRTVEIVVEFHRPTSLAECGSRKLLAGYCYERVANGLASALSGRRGLRPEPSKEPERLPAVPLSGQAPAVGRAARRGAHARTTDRR